MNKPRMKILIIGQNTKLAYTLNSFADIYMVVDSSINNFRRYKEADNYHIIESKTNITSTISFFIRSKEIKHWLKNNHFDLIFTNEKNSMIAAKIATLFQKDRPKLISTSHNSYAWVENNWKTKCYTRLIDWCTDGYMALASFVAEILKNNGLQSKKILIQPNTIEYELFCKKEDYSISNNRIKLVYVATIYPGKGQDILLKALKILQNRGISVAVDLFGDVIDQQYKEKLDEYVATNNLAESVSFKGRVDNQFIKQNLSFYDFYVSPSRMEMSPFNILEAKAAALPVIAYHVGGIPDIITTQVDGLLLNSFEDSVLADNIQYLIQNENVRKNIGEAAYKNVSEVNSPVKAANNLRNFINRI